MIIIKITITNLSTANGLHINLSLWNNRNENLFIDTKDQKLGISKICRNFIGGILDHVVESCAIFCPTMNSYKRLFLNRIKIKVKKKY